ncbi:MAG: hypothetical protein AMXMBFR64_47020 [Myxococcales bacterium]
MTTLDEYIHRIESRSRRSPGALVISAKLLDVARLAATSTPHALYGSVEPADDGPIYRVQAVSADPTLDQRLGVVLMPGTTFDTSDIVLRASDAVATQGGLPIDVVVVDESKYLDRVRGVPGADALSSKTVVVVGTGSVGSDLATRLARLGLAVHAVDPERLETENLVRWGLMVSPSSVGRRKALVWRDAVRASVPGARVEGHALNVVRDAVAFSDLLQTARPDLVVVATDTRDSRAVVNGLAARLGFPTLYVAFSDLAASVRIELVTDAAKGPCHLCSTYAEGGRHAPVRGSLQPYAVETAPARGVPALPVNVTLGTAIAARLALVFVSGAPVDPWFSHGEQRGNLMFVTMEPETWVFEEPLDRLVVQAERWPECPVCGGGDD